MFRKIISALLLLIILGSFTPVVPVANAAATGGGETLEIDQACIDAGNSFSGEIGGFVISNILWGVSFMAVDMLTSFLETLTIFGFNVGGIFEPFDQAMNFMRDIWMKSLIYGVIASVFNWFAGSLIESAMVLNLTLTADNALVAYGGKIILQIANFGFVIAIIFVGIATILRLKKDELSANKLLIKLIVGIILVNLTIPIASAIADLGTRVTMAMYKASSPCPENITKHFTVWSLKAKIMNLLGESAEGTGMVPPTDDPEFSIGEGDEEDDSGLSEDERKRLNEQKDKVDDQASAFTGLAGGLALDFLSMIVAAVLSLIAALTFLTFGAFLIIRFVILMLLLTFSPLIWFGFIFKDLKLGKSGNIWSAWWGQFLKWTFFGPIIVLFLAFVSEYLNVAASSSPLISASSQLSAVPAGVELFGIAQLIAVIIIAAMGIFLAAKFSGVAGSLAIAAATGGLGFVAGKAQGILKRGQMSTQMRAEQLKAQGRGNSLSAKALRLSSKGLGQAATGASLSGGASALLKQVGVKPNVNVPTDDEIRKGIIEKRMTRPIGGGTQRAKISIGEGGKTKIFGKEFTTSAGVKDTSENVLSLTQNDIKNMSADAKKEATAAIRKVQDKYIANNSALKTKQVVALRKLEKAMSTELTDHILGGLDLADPTKNPESALGLSNANLANIGKEGGMEEKEKVDHAIAQMGMGFSSLTPDQQKEYTRLRTKVDLLQKKGEW